MHAIQMRDDYPRPQFERASWLNLNGEWEFEFDDEQAGDKEKWYLEHTFSRKIYVPFSFQSKLSGVGDPGFHDVVWYRTMTALPPEFFGKRVLLHFGAVDYSARVWVNGQFVASHEGGHTPFSVDITGALSEGENVIVVKAQDFSTDMTLPRGKQYWKEKPQAIYYSRTTGIWQTVWMEAVAGTYLDKVKFTPDIDNNEIHLLTFINGYDEAADIRLQTRILFKGTEIADDEIRVKGPEEARRIALHECNEHRLHRFWSPERPNLYDAAFTLLVNGEVVDEVKTYFGMRKIAVEDGTICLNNKPYKMKMVLDQGYFPESNLTPPSDEAIRSDVEMTRAMGFNGARKHQKIEDPRYLYWCDKLGLLVWGEMANAYKYSGQYVRRMTQEWQEAVERDYNHPCIVAWVPINESWGVPNIQFDEQQQQHVLAMYHLTKSLDRTRLVISNDGWEHVKSDICTIHDYQWRREILEERYSSAEKAVRAKPANRWIHVPGFPYQGEPIHVSEFGGIKFKKSDWEGWGYSGAENEQDFIDRLVAVIHPLLESTVIQGYCYTQLTDVEQEINGLLTYDRKPKIPLELIKQINEGKVPAL